MPNTDKERRSAAEPKNLVGLLGKTKREQLIPVLRQYKIVSVESDTITIDTGAGVIPGIRYMNSYAPTAGDAVWCLESGNDIVAVGKLGQNEYVNRDGDTMTGVLTVLDNEGMWVGRDDDEEPAGRIVASAVGGGSLRILLYDKVDGTILSRAHLDADGVLRLQNTDLEVDGVLGFEGEGGNHTIEQTGSGDTDRLKISSRDGHTITRWFTGDRDGASSVSGFEVRIGSSNAFAVKGNGDTRVHNDLDVNGDLKSSSHVELAGANGGSGANRVQIGAGASQEPADDAIVIGTDAYVTNSRAIAIGKDARAEGFNAVAIGRNAVASSNNTMSLMSSSDAVEVPGDFDVDGDILLGGDNAITHGGGEMALGAGFSDVTVLNDFFVDGSKNARVRDPEDETTAYFFGADESPHAGRFTLDLDIVVPDSGEVDVEEVPDYVKRIARTPRIRCVEPQGHSGRAWGKIIETDGSWKLEVHGDPGEYFVEVVAIRDDPRIQDWKHIREVGKKEDDPDDEGEG